MAKLTTNNSGRGQRVGHSSENKLMAKSKNRDWIKQHLNDPYVKQATT